MILIFKRNKLHRRQQLINFKTFHDKWKIPAQFYVHIHKRNSSMVWICADFHHSLSSLQNFSSWISSCTRLIFTWKLFPTNQDFIHVEIIFPLFFISSSCCYEKFTMWKLYQMKFSCTWVMPHDAGRGWSLKIQHKHSDKISTKAYLTFTSNKNIVQHQNCVIFVSFVSMRQQHFIWAK